MAASPPTAATKTESSTEEKPELKRDSSFFAKSCNVDDECEARGCLYDDLFYFQVCEGTCLNMSRIWSELPSQSHFFWDSWHLDELFVLD